MIQGNAALELLERNVDQRPDKTVYICGDRTLSFRELDEHSKNFVRILRDKKVNPGERVLIVLPNVFAFPVAFLGCLLSGVVATAANSALNKESYEYILHDCGARLLVTHPDLAEPVAAANGNIEVLYCDKHGLFEYPATSPAAWKPYQPKEKDLAYMLYTSGSTGNPKGVPHRHQDLLFSCELLGVALLNITADDLIFCTSQFSFTYNLIFGIAYPLFFGAAAILHPARPDAKTVLDILKNRKPTVFASIPSMYAQLILSCTENSLSFPMRLCYSSGESLPAAVFEEWKRLSGLELIEGIGSTESTSAYISNRPGNARPGSAGQPVPGYDVRIVDDEGNTVLSGIEGILHVKGPTIAPYYWNLPRKSAVSMGADGYFRTGDLFVENDGFYYYRGRSDDRIKSGACWVSPVLIENALLSHPSVAECAVASIHIGTLGKPGAFVVLAPGVAIQPELTRELREHLRARLPEHMLPARYEFVSDLPHTPTGKIQRFRLGDSNTPAENSPS